MQSPHHRDIDLTAQNPASPEQQSPAANEPASDDSLLPEGSVLDLIADVEARLRKVRDLQSDHDSQLASLDERKQALDAAEQSLREREETLISLEQELSKIRGSLEHRSGELDERAAQIEREAQDVSSGRESLETERQQLDEERAKLQQQSELLNQHWEDMEKERIRLSELQEDVTRAQQSLTEDRAAMEREHAAQQERGQQIESESGRLREAHREMEERLHRAEENVGELIQQVETAQDEMQSRAAERDEAKAAAEQAANRLAELERSLNETKSALEASNAKIAESEQRVEQAESEALQMVEHAETERDALKAEHQRLQQEAGGLRERITSLEAQAQEAVEAQQQAEARAKELESALAAKSQEIEKQRETLNSAKAKLGEFAKSIGEQAKQIERGAAALATVREQKQEIEKLRHELAQAKMAGNPEEVQRKDERIQELTQALREARGQSTSQGALAERDERIAECMEEIDRLKLDLEHARHEAQDLRETLENRPDATADEEIIAERDRRIEALMQQVESLNEALEAERSKPAPTGNGNGAASADIQKKAQRLKEVARHLQRRKARLGRMKSLLHDARPMTLETGDAGAKQAAAHKDHELRAKQMDQLRLQQESLREAMRCLMMSEKEMIRRWARPRAMVTMAWFFIVAGIVAAGSWFATDHFFPAVRAATVTIEAQDRPGFPMTDEQLAAWQTWHEGTLGDASFRKILAQRFESRGMKEMVDPEIVQERFTNHLTLDSTRNGELTLTLVGTDADELMNTLDTVAITLVSEARRQSGQRTDGGRTALVGERKIDGQPRYATVNNVPVKDERLMYAGSMFGGGLLLVMIIWLGLYMKLAKARRVFDENDPMYSTVADPA